MLVLPDPADAVTHLWAEGTDADTAQLLLDEWAVVVEQADRIAAEPSRAGEMNPLLAGNLC